MHIIDPADLPEVISRYLDAHRDENVSAALGAFAADATVVDDGHTHAGRPAIDRWLTRTAGEYTYTTTLTGAHRIDDGHYVATQHLEGDFPGGQVDLRYDFTLKGDRITALTIAP